MSEASRITLPVPLKRLCRLMSEPPRDASLIAELDRRQNDVLTQLDELNDKVERMLEECLAARSAELQVAGFE